MVPGNIVATLFKSSLGASAVDAYFNYTSLLLNGEAASTASYLSTNANSLVVDQGFNNLTMTSSTTISQGSFNPYNGSYYSFLLNGSSSAVTVPSSSLSISYNGKKTTFEFWIYPIAFSTGNSGITSVITNQNASGAKSQVTITCESGVSTTTAKIGLYSATTNTRVLSTGTISSGTWNHIVVEVDVTTPSTTNEVIFFINGVKETKSHNFSGVTSGDASTSPLQIGGNGYYTNYLNGYISNVRIVQDSSYVYTGAALTVPTSPLGTTTGCVLLTGQSNRYVDISPIGSTLGTTGTPQVSPFTPFSFNTSYTSNSPSGGVWTTGSNYLSVADNSALELGSGDFTIECWFNPSTTSGNQAIFSKGAYSYLVAFLSGSLSLYLSSNGTSWDIANGLSLGNATANAWYHVAVARVGSNIYAFVNGVLKQTVNSSATIFNNSSALTLGYWTNGESTFSGFSGTVADFRIVQGTGVYSSAFVPPQSQLTAISGTSFLTCQAGSVVDNSSSGLTVTTMTGNFPAYNYPYSNTGNSFFFTGTSGDYIQFGGQSDFAFGTNDFTIEFWVNLNTIASDQQIFSTQATNSYNTSPDIWFKTTTKTLNLQVAGSGSRIVGTYALQANTWYHVAVSRVSGQTRLFVNGIQDGSTYADSNTYTIPANRPLIGAYGYNTSAYPFNGAISNIRIVNGTGLYSSNFVPSNGKFTEVTNTVLLMTGGFIGDTSSRKNMPTVVGSPKVIRSSPFDFGLTGNFSTYFSGTDVLAAQKSSQFSFTGDFTVECWVYPTNLSAERTIFTLSSVGSSGWNYDDSNVAINGLALSQSRLSIGSTNLSFTSAILKTNKWQHVAVVRSGSTVTVYVDGSNVYSTTFASTIGSSNTTPALGTLDKYQGSYRLPFVGSISNFRMVNGTAVYTSSFTAPTQALSAITNTVLLVCNSYRHGDYSSNNFQMVPYGSPTITALAKPFTGSSWDSGSVYFNGSSYVNGPSSSMATVFGSTLQSSSTFTIETWIYPTASGSAIPNIIGDMNPLTSVYSWAFGLNASNQVGFYWTDGTAKSAVGNTVVPLNAWSHIAVTSNAGALSIYVNGVKQTLTGTTTLTTASGGVGYLTVGSYNSTRFTGYMSNLRCSKFVLYRDSFSVPTEPITSGSDTNFCLSGTNATIIDYTRKNDLVVTATALSPTVKKYGSNSLYFNGSSSVSAPCPNLSVFTNWTVEAWVYMNTSATNQDFFHFNSSSAAGIQIYKNSSNGITVDNVAGSTGAAASANSIVSANTWFHLAVVKNGSTITVYKDGVSVASTSTLTIGAVNNVLIGKQYNVSTYNFTGYMDDIRITLGVARYVTAFSPPSASFYLK